MSYLYDLSLSLLEGLNITLEIFTTTLVLSILSGIIIALLRLSKIKLLSTIAQFYILIMRGTPLLLQLIFVFFGLPLLGLTLDRFSASLIAFVLNYAAYFGEIFRGGIESIDKGQYEAAMVLGLSKFKTFYRIILPQTIKRTLPPISNEVITLIKDTSLVYVVGLGEVLRAGKIASNRDASLLPLIMVALVYLILTCFFTLGFKTIEKKFSYYQ